MSATFYLVPRGEPSRFARWHDSSPREVTGYEVGEGWHARPVDNPACPILFYPRFAWCAVDSPNVQPIPEPIPNRGPQEVTL